MTKGIAKPRWYKKVGVSNIGKYILVGITYVDLKGNETQKQQLHGADGSRSEESYVPEHQDPLQLRSPGHG